MIFAAFGQETQQRWVPLANPGAGVKATQVALTVLSTYTQQGKYCPGVGDPCVPNTNGVFDPPTLAAIAHAFVDALDAIPVIDNLIPDELTSIIRQAAGSKAAITTAFSLGGDQIGNWLDSAGSMIGPYIEDIAEYIKEWYDKSTGAWEKISSSQLLQAAKYVFGIGAAPAGAPSLPGREPAADPFERFRRRAVVTERAALTPMVSVTPTAITQVAPPSGSFYVFDPSISKFRAFLPV